MRENFRFQFDIYMRSLAARQTLLSGGVWFCRFCAQPKANIKWRPWASNLCVCVLWRDFVSTVQQLYATYRLTHNQNLFYYHEVRSSVRVKRICMRNGSNNAHFDVNRFCVRLKKWLRRCVALIGQQLIGLLLPFKRFIAIAIDERQSDIVVKQFSYCLAAGFFFFSLLSRLVSSLIRVQTKPDSKFRKIRNN